MLKVRLQGTAEEVQKGVEELEKYFRVLEVSRPYKNRNSEYYRVYMDIEFDDE